MLSGEGMQRRRTVKNKNRSNQQKKELCTCSTLFLYISLPLFCTTTTLNFQKLLSYTFYGGNVVRVLVHFFPLPLIFTMHYWWLLAFLILSPPLQNSFFKPLSPFFLLSFAGLPPTFSFSPSFCCSIFQICGYDNLA